MDPRVLVEAGARNLKYCFRSLRKNPGFVMVAMLILTTAIGSNVTVFSTMDALLLRPLPVERPEELMSISLIGQQGNLGPIPSTALEVLKENRAFEGTCGFDTEMTGAEIEGNVRSVGMSGFTGGCFDALHLHLQLGRAITASDDHPGSAKIAVITDALWQSAYGGRPDVLGKTIKIGGQMYTIVGVSQKRFTGLLMGFPQHVMIPLLQKPDLLETKPTWRWVNLLARRAAGDSGVTGPNECFCAEERTSGTQRAAPLQRGPA